MRPRCSILMLDLRFLLGVMGAGVTTRWCCWLKKRVWARRLEILRVRFIVPGFSFSIPPVLVGALEAKVLRLLKKELLRGMPEGERFTARCGCELSIPPSLLFCCEVDLEAITLRLLKNELVRGMPEGVGIGEAWLSVFEEVE